MPPRPTMSPSAAPPGVWVGAVVACALGAALLAAGCGDRGRQHVFEERTASALPLAPQGALRIATRSADVHLTPSPDDTVRVLVYKRVQSMSERSVQALVEQIRVTIERQGDELILRVREPERGRGKVTVQAGPWRLKRGVEIELTVAVPARARVAWETERGDLDAHNLASSLDAQATSGDFDLVGLTGPVRVRATSGDVSLRQVRAPVQVRLTNGDVDAVEVTGNLMVRATSGDVSASVLRGAVSIETSTGDIELHDAVGPVSVSASAGDVLVEARPDSLRIDTASGDITAKVEGTPKLVYVKSSSGSVELRLAPGAGGGIDLQTASGGMQVRIPVDVQSMTRNRLIGRMNGSARVEVRTSSGDITLRTEGPQ